MTDPDHETDPMPETDPKYSIGFQPQDANKPTFAVGGAFGGPTADGSAVVAHLYVEYGALPNYMTYETIETEEGERLDPSSEQRVTRHDRIREVQATIHLTPEVAIALAQWLVQNAEIALKRRGGN